MISRNSVQALMIEKSERTEKKNQTLYLIDISILLHKNDS